ncbi:MAG TPA: ABC transporter permease [Acidobacteriota bacterium]|nr:ABC transporter permease [Acidobacteriota bacterium]
MLKNYIKMALKVLRRRKFFTFISLFAIGFTLTVLTITAALLDHTLAPMPPETMAGRTLGIYRVEARGENLHVRSSPGYRLLERCLPNLPGAEAVTIFSNHTSVNSYVEGRKIESQLKRTDGAYWEIMDFHFLEGHPYTEEDVRNANFVAVINDRTRREFFGGGSAAGRTIEADAQRFRVVGVVADVPIYRNNPFADIWVPTTTAKNDLYRSQYIAGFTGLILAKERAAFADIRAEYQTRLSQIDLSELDYENVDVFLSRPETYFEAASREMLNTSIEDTKTIYLFAYVAGLMILFMLLPTISLVNINVSRILERASEIGVRKAFGASRLTLVGQFVTENVILTLFGGVIALAASYVILIAVTHSGLIPYAEFEPNLRIFAAALGIALFFGVFSGVYPAWKMSRLHPVEALRGKML